MQEVSQQHGRTILFVSHNLKAINDICDKAVLLDKGKLIMVDSVEKVTNQYINSLNTGINIRSLGNSDPKPVSISQVKTCDAQHANKFTFNSTDKIGIGITIQNNGWQHGFTIGFGLNSISKGRILRSQYFCSPVVLNSAKEFIVWLPAEDLTPGSFTIDVSVLDDKKETLDFITDALNFDISVANTRFEGMEYDYGVISKELTWQEAN